MKTLSPLEHQDRVRRAWREIGTHTPLDTANAAVLTGLSRDETRRALTDLSFRGLVFTMHPPGQLPYYTAARHL